jgi:hypothetical protein
MASTGTHRLLAKFAEYDALMNISGALASMVIFTHFFDNIPAKRTILIFP